MPYHFLKLLIIIFLCTTQTAYSITKHSIPANTHASKKIVKYQKRILSKKSSLHKKTVMRKKNPHAKKFSVKTVKKAKHQANKNKTLKRQLPGPIPHAALPHYLLSEREKSLVDYIYQTIHSMRYTTYQLGGSRIDKTRGIYIVDCSSYVNHILKNVFPKAFTSLTTSTGTGKPTTYDFYQYFSRLNSNKKQPWQNIDAVDQLRPGDILVFRYLNTKGQESGGHVMIVMDKPVRYGEKYVIRVTDSASAGHSKDTRKRHVSGIGVGILSLKVNSKTFKPKAYAWTLGSQWKTRVNFAMARPLEIKS